MGGNAPSRWKTADTAVTEVYFKGVSAGAAKGIMAELGIGDLTPPTASRIVTELDGQMEAWRTRPLGEMRWLCFDARFEKVRICDGG